MYLKTCFYKYLCKCHFFKFIKYFNTSAVVIKRSFNRCKLSRSRFSIWCSSPTTELLRI